MSDWRLAESLKRMFTEINALAPKRSKDNDGSIGDTAHSSRRSDHNPDDDGVVKAIDITHDPRNGVDCNKLADALKLSHDERIKYVIWNRRIWNPSVSTEWRPYEGTNPHDHHIHISVRPQREYFDSTRDWAAIGDTPFVPNIAAPPVVPTLRVGSVGPDIQKLWNALAAQSKDFDEVLEAAVKAYQKKRGLTVDGRVGPQTRKELKI